MMMCQYCTISSDSITSTPLFLRRYRSSLKTGLARPGPARDITHQRQQHIVTFRHLDTIILPFVYWKRYLWSRLAPPTNLVNWSKRSERLFERSQSLCRTTIGDRAFFVAAQRVWNTLPTSTTASETLSTFKRRLRMHLFSTSFTLFFPNCAYRIFFCISTLKSVLEVGLIFTQWYSNNIHLIIIRIIFIFLWVFLWLLVLCDSISVWSACIYQNGALTCLVITAWLPLMARCPSIRRQSSGHISNTKQDRPILLLVVL